MKTKLLLLASLFGSATIAQTITYANFSQSITDTIPVNIANNSSYNTSLSSITGSNVTWDASALTLQAGPPTIHLSYHPSSGTPQGAQYPSSNFCEYDPALTSIISYNYCGFGTDSLVQWGAYASNGTHEIFQDPDKRLIFPFNYGQSFTDNYAKTNYSNATTVSSYQTGIRTVTYDGFGTLVLPQGSFGNVALISEVRTNSLGPDSYNYTWYEVSTGKKLLYRSENNGSTTTVWCADPAAPVGINTGYAKVKLNVFPNPMSEKVTFKIETDEKMINATMILFNTLGQEVRSAKILGPELTIERGELENGVYFYSIIADNKTLIREKLVIQ